MQYFRPMLDPREILVFKEYLGKMAPRSCYLEIGVLLGGSLLFAIQHTKDTLCYGIDPLGIDVMSQFQEKTTMPILEHPLFALFRQINRLPGHDRSRIRLIPSLSQEAVPNLGPLSIGVLLIDGDHTYESVMRDSTYIDFVVPGGYVLFHDYSEENFPGVFRAVNELSEGSLELECVTVTLAAFRKI